MRFGIPFLVPCLGTALIALAQPPHAGTWEIDYASSDPGEVVLAFNDIGSGLWEFSANGRRVLQFRIDAEPCASCQASEPWKPIGPNTWDTGWLSSSGAADIVKIAADGRSLSLVSEGTTRIFERLSGGPGLSGVWRLEIERSDSPPLIELSPAVDDWFVFKSPTEGLICVLLLDGGDHHCSSAAFSSAASSSPSWTIAMRTTDMRTLAVAVKKDGETAAESSYTVSADGRSMTQTERSASGANVKTVYTRQ
jgi:hypothetical protein